MKTINIKQARGNFRVRTLFRYGEPPTIALCFPRFWKNVVDWLKEGQTVSLSLEANNCIVIRPMLKVSEAFKSKGGKQQ